MDIFWRQNLPEFTGGLDVVDKEREKSEIFPLILWTMDSAIDWDSEQWRGDKSGEKHQEIDLCET